MTEAVLIVIGLVAGIIIGVVGGLIVGRLLASAPRVAAEARLGEANRQLGEQRKLLEEAKAQLADQFKALSSEALSASNQQFLALATETLGKVAAETKGDLGKRQEAIDGLIRPLQDALKRYEEQVAGLEQKREKAYGSLEQQLSTVASTQQQLQSETRNLVTALRRPEVRGRWGEITLQRVVEISGMAERCDFDLQPSVITEDGMLRPDLIVHLPDERTIVVDAKTPVDAYLDAVEATEEASRNAALQRHAAHVRAHVQKLSLKAYWDQFERAPDFVVLFLPGESFFSAALEQDRELVETSFRSKVLLASPTTLLALLRSVAASWHQERIIENAEEIARGSREFCERVRKFAEHLGRIREGLDRASKAYNDAVGSWQSRVLPSGRRVAELGGAGREGEVAELEPVEVALRELPAAEGKAAEDSSAADADEAASEVVV